ncbi:hypothetical protein ONE63_008840 [Megalurothrips usitatus]|uniref:Mucin-5AC-like n=1 Tax=Megalurothrips usitatus TaxID=439358 RepID=A0AAV7XJA3_9NEOP|nr:hypothetical protein ONE63_008840 [Megalurothrips usitatus]
MSYRDDDDPFEEDIVFDQAGLLSTSRKCSKSAIRRVSSGKCAMFSKTLGLCGAFLGLGLTFAIPGPLSPVPPAELRSDITLMTYEVMYRCQGFMIGAMFGARLLDRFNRLFLVFLALLVTALLVTIIPWCGINWLLRTDMFLLGVSLGFLTTGGNVLCLDLWGRNSGPFMQALHFSFSLGIFLAPFLSQPLMAPINYSVVVPSTTPAMFPLHRLPREVGNLTSAGAHLAVTEDPLHYSSSSPHPSWTSNKSSPLSSDLSTASLLPSVPSKTFKPVWLDGFNSSAANASLPMATKTSSLPTPTVPSSSKGTGSISSVQPRNQSTIANSLVTTASSLLVGNATNSVNASKTDVSTTTHRAPRPKPVLVNSDKLQDKKWENEKFRKPPPEDLVPVSTTMKAMTRPGNKTVTSGNSSTSIPPLALPGNNSTADIPLNSTKLTKSLSIQPSLNATAASNSSVSSPPSSIAPQVTATSSIAPALSASSVPLVMKSTASMNGSVNTSLQISSTVPSETSLRQMNSSAGIGIPRTSALPVYNSSMRSLSILEKSNTPSPIPLKPTTHVPEKAIEVKVEKGQGDALPGSSPSDITSTSISSNSGKSVSDSKKVLPLQAHPSSDASAISGSIKKHIQGKVLSPISKDHRLGNDSHDIGKSISLDEQEVLAPNVAEMTQSFTTSAPLKKHLKATNTSVLESQVQSFGGSHVKAILKAKTVPPVVSDHGSQVVHPHRESAPKQPEPPASKYNSGGALHSISTTPASFKTSPRVVEDPVYVEPSVSPKRTHHSKPASTVVNDTEVIHTVIDAVANRLEKYGLSRMALMYLTVGMVLLATSLLFLGFLCFNPRDPKSKTDEEDMNGHVTRGGARSRSSTGQLSIVPSRCLRHTLIGLMLLLLMVTSGVQAMYGQLLMVYAIQPPLQLSQSTGSALTATFWGALTSTRFACILLASALSPTSMLVLSVAICSCATWLLSAFASSSEVALWIGSVMVSVGTASVFPSSMLWMQRHILITHRTAAMLVMGPAMGEMFFPTLAYKMMVSMGPASLIHLPALLSLFAIALWAATWRLARYPRQSLCSHVDESSGYQLANQNDEDDLLDLTMSPIVNGSGTISRNSLRSTASAHSVHRMSA